MNYFYKYNKNMLAVEEFISANAPKSYSSVYRALIAVSSKQGVALISQRDIAMYLHISSSTVKRAIRYLTKHYFIGIALVSLSSKSHKSNKSQGRGMANVYVINPNLVWRMKNTPYNEKLKAREGQLMGFNVHVTTKINKQLAKFVNNFNELHKKYSYRQPDFKKLRVRSSKVAKKLFGSNQTKPSTTKRSSVSSKPRRSAKIDRTHSVSYDTGEIKATTSVNDYIDYIRSVHGFRITKNFKRNFARVCREYDITLARVHDALAELKFRELTPFNWLQAQTDSPIKKLSSKPYYFLSLIKGRVEDYWQKQFLLYLESYVMDLLMSKHMNLEPHEKKLRQKYPQVSAKQIYKEQGKLDFQLIKLDHLVKDCVYLVRKNDFQHLQKELVAFNLNMKLYHSIYKNQMIRLQSKYGGSNTDEKRRLNYNN